MTLKKLSVCVIALFFFCILLLFCRTFWTLSHTYTPDFSVYHQAAVNMLGSTSVYTGKTAFTSFSYPLVSAIFFIPFAFLPYQLSQTLFLTLNFFALLGISILTPKIVLKKYSIFISALVFSFSYLSFPTKFTLGMGQINLVAYFFLLLSLFFYVQELNPVRHEKGSTLNFPYAALFFAIACVLKPVLGFMLLFFIFQREWKIIAFTFVFLLASFIFTLPIDHHALQDNFYYLQHVVPEVSRPVGKQIYYNQGFMSFIFREITNQIWRLRISYFGMMTIFLCGLFAVYKNKNYLFRFALLLSMLPLLDTLSWQHHFIVLIFPFFYFAYLCWKEKSLSVSILLIVSYILVSWNFAHPELFLSFPLNLLLSNTFFGAFLLYVLYVGKELRVRKRN